MAPRGARPGTSLAVSRRGLLVGGGAAIGLIVAWQVWPRSYEPNLSIDEGETGFGAFLKIGIDGRVIVAVPQAELGQGSYTALPQILADELGADWNTVAVEPAPLSPLYANPLFLEAFAKSALPTGAGRWAMEEQAERSALMVTGGSTSVRAFEPRLRQAGAAARALLQMEAAGRWGANWEELDAVGGFVVVGDQRLPFAALAAGAARRELPDNLPVRGGIENRLAGQELPRIDTPAKIDGSARFAGDIRLPGMLFASVRSGPPGSRLLRFDRDAGARVHGVAAIFRNPEWLGVAATTWWAATRALDEMRAQFSVPAGAATNASIERVLTAALTGEAETIVATGDHAAQLAANDAITEHYGVDPAPSAPPETMSATVRVTGDRMEVWAATQAPGLARAAAARATGFGADRITIHPTIGGGGYGRRLETDAIAQAAVMAVNLGRPIQLVWPRIEEIKKDRMRPPALARMTARYGNGGTIAAWGARIAVPRTTALLFERLQPGPLIRASDAADLAGAEPPYGIPALKIERAAAEIGIETGLGRGGAHSYTAFFTECFIDELAQRASMEPVGFRMQMLTANPRAAQVLNMAATLGGWDGGRAGSGMGIALHSAFGSYIALLAEIELSAEQRPRVLRAVAAVDCGRVVNPNLVRQQIEGGILHALSGAVGRPPIFEQGLPTANDIGALGLPRLADTPEISVEILPSEDDPGGVTDLGVAPVAPALANALASLTGRRLRRLPLVIGPRS